MNTCLNCGAPNDSAKIQEDTLGNFIQCGECSATFDAPRNEKKWDVTIDTKTHQHWLEVFAPTKKEAKEVGLENSSARKEDVLKITAKKQ
jgi:transcription elongation factor Elf1